MYVVGGLGADDKVNLELPLAVGDRLDGHIVQGHVDGVGTVRALRDEGFSRVLTIALAPELLRYVAEKGSITVDGVSLTVVSIDDHSFTVSLIPTTLRETTLGERKPGDAVNVVKKADSEELDWHDPVNQTDVMIIPGDGRSPVPLLVAAHAELNRRNPSRPCPQSRSPKWEYPPSEQSASDTLPKIGRAHV